MKDIIIAVFSDSDTYFRLLMVIGFWKIFQKFGENKWLAIVPIVRTYKLSCCADREEEGRIWCIADFFAAISIGVLEAMRHLSVGRTTLYMMVIVVMVFSAVDFIYSIRVYAGICEIFGKKKCTVLWVFFEGIMSCIWGFSSKYQPVNRVIEEDESAAAESGTEVKTIDKGLTVNINERVYKSLFKKKVLLKDIHFNVEPGNMVMLLGGSGAGKTTLLNAITGYEKADAKIMLNGVDVYDRYDKMKYKIGFAPQQDLIRYNDTVYRTLYDAALLKLPVEMTSKERHERVNEVLDIFGLTPSKDSKVAHQSGGQKKRISIATEYISDPYLFILDEPDSGLDGIMARDLMQRLHDISREGKIVIVITHTPDRVVDLFDKVMVLAKDNNRSGRLVYFGAIDEAKEFFGTEKMEDIVKAINRKEEGGDGRADELIEKFLEVQNGTV